MNLNYNITNTTTNKIISIISHKEEIFNQLKCQGNKSIYKCNINIEDTKQFQTTK